MMIRRAVGLAALISTLASGVAWAQLPALGAQPVIFVKVHFSVHPPYDPKVNLTTMANESDAKLRYISRGKAWYDAQAFGTILEITVSPDAPLSTIEAAMEAAYVAAGGSTGGTPCRKRIYVWDPTVYGGSGQSRVGCALHVRSLSADVVVHEWLHAVAFHHVHLAPIPDYSYHDTGSLGYPDPWMAERLGWVLPQAVSAAGTYVIKPWESPDGNAIKLNVSDVTIPFGMSVIELGNAYDAIFVTSGTVGSPYYPYRLDTDTASGSFKEYLSAGASVIYTPWRLTHGGVNPDRSVNVIVTAASSPPPNPDPSPQPPSGDLTTGGTATSSETQSPSGEGVMQAFDDKPATKWLTWRGTNTWIAYQFSAAVTVSSYALTSANDVDARDPKDWRLEGSNDGTTWTTLDTKTGQFFAGRLLKQTYTLAASANFSRYRLFIVANRGAGETQLAELELFGSGGSPPPTDPCIANPYTLTAADVTVKNAASWTGTVTGTRSDGCKATVKN